MNQLAPQKIEALTESILQQAKRFLEDADEFYPFGSVVDKNENIKPISIYWGEEFPDSSQVLDKLEERIKQGIKINDYMAGAIGLDVYIKTNSQSGMAEITALELRLYQENIFVTSHFHYYKENDRYFFKPVTVLSQ